MPGPRHDSDLWRNAADTECSDRSQRPSSHLARQFWFAWQTADSVSTWTAYIRPYFGVWSRWTHPRRSLLPSRRRSASTMHTEGPDRFTSPPPHESHVSPYHCDIAVCSIACPGSGRLGTPVHARNRCGSNRFVGRPIPLNIQTHGNVGFGMALRGAGKETKSNAKKICRQSMCIAKLTRTREKDSCRICKKQNDAERCGYTT